MQNQYFFLGIFIICEQFKELSPSHFEKLIIFLTEIQCFKFGRADLPFPGQDMVKVLEYSEIPVYNLGHEYLSILTN